MKVFKYKNASNLANCPNIRTVGGFGSYPRIILQFLCNEIPFIWTCLFCIRRLRFDYGEHRTNLFYVRPVRRISTEIRSGLVRSAVSDRSRTDLGPDRSHKKFSDGAKLFEKLDRVAAIDFVKKSSKSELSSRFLSRSKLENTARHFLANSADHPRI